VKLPCSHVNHVYVRTWSFTFARRHGWRTKLYVPTWNSTCERGVSRANVKLHVRTSTIYILRAHVDVSRSHVDMVDVRTSNSTFPRETPRANVEFHVRTWNSTFARQPYIYYVRTWSFTFARRYGWRTNVKLYVPTSNSTFARGVRFTCERETPRSHVNHTCARGVSRSHVDMVDVRTSNSTFPRQTPRANVEFHVGTWSLT